MGILDQELAKFAQSKRGKELISGASKSKKQASLGKGTMAFAEEIEDYVFYMKKILTREMVENGLGAYVDIEYEVVPTAKTIDGNPCVKINMAFGDGAASPSLNIESGQEVILPRLLNTGFKVNKRPPAGLWLSKSRGMILGQSGLMGRKPIIGIRERKGLHFIEQACADFNNYTGGMAIAEYNNISAGNFS